MKTIEHYLEREQKITVDDTSELCFGVVRGDIKLKINQQRTMIAGYLMWIRLL